MTVSDITGSHSSIALTSGQYANPVTVDLAASVIATSGGSYGLAAQTSWTIQNFGSIVASSGVGIDTSGVGIDLVAGGTVINGDGSGVGVITGGADGIDISAASVRW